MDLQIGGRVPDFVATDSNGNEFKSNALIGKKIVVFYFYPKDDTPGCTTQACGFRDQYEIFKDLGAEVVGISSDGINSHQDFIKKYKLPFILLSDKDKELRKLFGVKPNIFGLLPGRVTYVADQNGIVQFVFDGLVASKHVPKVLEMIKRIAE